MKRPSILFVCRYAPYGSSLAREGLEAILAAGCYQQQVSVLFMDDGVLQLLRNQQPESIARKNHGAMLNALPMYDIENLYADAKSLNSHYLDDTDICNAVSVIETNKVKQLFSQHDHILSF